MAQERQLVAIFFADIQGFTALVQFNESKAKIIRDKFHRSSETIFESHRGNIVHFQGDGVCCIFRSAVDAVLAGIELQLTMLREPEVPLRIGINLGDVIVDGKDIFGDGVNIASRAESFAIPGSIIITDSVYHEIRNQPDIKAVSLGNFEFKNARGIIELYAISNSGLIIPHQKTLTGKGKAISNRKYWLITTAALLLLGAASFFYFSFLKESENDKSIAVLPFTNQGIDQKEDYLSDGIAEDILTSLSHIDEFTVTSFASTRQYKGTKKTIRQIADELDVNYVMVGSVQHSGDYLRINTELIKAKSGIQVWAENFNEPFTEILAIQSKVASEIAAGLKTKLSSYEKKRIQKHSTMNSTAYDLYLKGRYYWNLRTPESLDTSIQFFSKAIRIDPNFALAYSGIADAYTVLGDNGYEPLDKVAANAKQAVNKALELDSSLAEVKASYAMYLSSLEGNGTASIQVLENLVRYNPNYASAFQWYAIELSAKGKFETAKEMIEKAIVLNPRSKRIYYTKALIYLFAKDINRAIQVLKEEPGGYTNDQFTIEILAKLYYLKNDPDSSKRYARLCNNEILLSVLKKDTSAAIRMITERKKKGSIPAQEIALFYTMAGQKDSAFIWLNKSVENKEYGGLKFLAVSPDWDLLRNDPRFAILLQNSGIR